ncbi:MAG: iron complex transport system substrate-binding protein [Solirubrobacteraceae bacterium]|nr:iron complex transport system substrate-binding protein [Solirubrobacteraceae bacterium]
MPHATELLFALGLGEQVVGVTHECDHPIAAGRLPTVTRDALPAGLSAAEIDREVKERIQRGEAIYALDESALRELEPDLIVTQELCPVCAVSYEEVAGLAQDLPGCPRVVALDPKTFGETLGDARTIAQLTGTREAALELVRATRARVDAVRRAVRGRPPVRVAAIEWFDPVFVAGHWTPQLIEWAGGEDLLGLPAEPSAQTTWEAVAAVEPEIVVAMPCGYDAETAYREAEAHAGALRATGARRVVAVDGGAYFSRPGPRLVEGLELLAAVLHPEVLGDAPAAALELDLRRP